MKCYKNILLQCLALIMMLGFAELTMAQDEARTEAIQLYNQAQELAEGDQFDDAIGLYRDALELSTENDLTDISELIEERLPRVYASRASGAYRQYQSERSITSINQAIEYFQESQEVAEEFNNNQVMEQANGAIPQLYYVRSILNYRQENFEESMTDLNTALEMNPNYAAAHYQKAVVLKKMDPGNVEVWLDQYDVAIEIAQEVNDNKTLASARNSARDELIYRAVNLAEDRQFPQAIELLNSVEKYDDSTYEVPYRLSEIANKRGNWSSAETNAREALELHNGGVADKAKIYFELGTALKGQGEFEQACSSFENARYGEFTEPANHELQFELKCEGHTATGR